MRDGTFKLILSGNGVANVRARATRKKKLPRIFFVVSVVTVGIVRRIVFIHVVLVLPHVVEVVSLSWVSCVLHLPFDAVARLILARVLWLARVASEPGGRQLRPKLVTPVGDMFARFVEGFVSSDAGARPEQPPTTKTRL